MNIGHPAQPGLLRRHNRWLLGRAFAGLGMVAVCLAHALMGALTLGLVLAVR